MVNVALYEKVSLIQDDITCDVVAAENGFDAVVISRWFQRVKGEEKIGILSQVKRQVRLKVVVRWLICDEKAINAKQSLEVIIRGAFALLATAIYKARGGKTRR